VVLWSCGWRRYGAVRFYQGPVEGGTGTYLCRPGRTTGVGIAAFIRDRLDQTDRVEEELASIRAAMIDMGETLDELRDRLADSSNSASAQVQPEPPIPNAVQIETLMLLRAIASSQDMRMVWGEPDRQEIKPWRGKVR